MKVYVPQHLTPDWIGQEVARRFHARHSGRAVRPTTYIHHKPISIREYISLAEKLKKHESI